MTKGEREHMAKVGVVVVHYITTFTTINYVRKSLLNQTGIEFEIVIVDNGSPDESTKILVSEFIHDSNVHVLTNSENRGYGAGCNTGIKFLEKLKCDYVLISNNDIGIDDPALVNKLVSVYSKLEAPCFVAPVMFENNRLSKDYAAWKIPGKITELIGSLYTLKVLFGWYLNKNRYKIREEEPLPLRVDCVAGSFFICAAEKFQVIGYFDEEVFLYYEETIMASKIRMKGLNNYILPYCRYNHLHAHTIDTVFTVRKKFRMNFESKVYYWKKVRSTGSGFLFLLRFIFLLHQFELFLTSLFRKRSQSQ